MTCGQRVFANFMAAKIVNPSFPEVNHDLNFYPAFSQRLAVDRTEGANPIRQDLQNLNEAGRSTAISFTTKRR